MKPGAAAGCGAGPRHAGLLLRRRAESALPAAAAAAAEVVGGVRAIVRAGRDSPQRLGVAGIPGQQGRRAVRKYAGIRRVPVVRSGERK